MTDAETSAAIEALAHRIRERDEAMRNGGEYADAEIFAAEYLAALRAKAGWRPTPAKVYAAPKPAGGARPAASLPDDYRAIRAEWEARPHPYRRDEEAS